MCLRRRARLVALLPLKAPTMNLVSTFAPPVALALSAALLAGLGGPAHAGTGERTDPATAPSRTVSDGVGDTNPGERTDARLTNLADIRYSTLSRGSGRVYLKYAMVRVDPPKVGVTQRTLMSAELGSKKVLFIAQVNSAGMSAGMQVLTYGAPTTFPCRSQVRGSYSTSADTISFSVPVSCLPTGTRLKDAITGAEVRKRLSGESGNGKLIAFDHTRYIDFQVRV
ncbi:MAG: hypothetical protein JWN84_4540 [Nocardioides sp.]|nr:hypothetical protein [Nocardioides sp.]